MPRKDRRLELRIEPELYDRITALLALIATYSQRPTVSEWVRYAIESELEYAEPKAAGDALRRYNLTADEVIAAVRKRSGPPIS